MKRLLATTLFATSTFLTAVSAQAADTYTFDKSHTNIIWFANHLGFSDTMGQFMDYDGEFTLDTEHPENSTVDVTVNIPSVNTGVEKLDEHLKSADFFNAEKFPTAHFKSTKVEVTGDNTAKIYGDLTMLGITKPLVLDATLKKIGENPLNKAQTAGFSVKGVIKRSDYGINYALPAVPDDVHILIETDAILKDNAKGE